MNAYINYFAYSYLKNNVDSINNCIQSYIEDGNTEKCENEVVRPWLNEHGPVLFSEVKDSKKEDKNTVKEVTSGLPNLSLSQADCEAYSKVVDSDFAVDEWPTQAATGCWIHDGKVRYNTVSNDKECGDKYGEHIVKCIQKTNPSNPTVDSFINIPKKSNGLMYVIFFILALVLFRKLKK